MEGGIRKCLMAQRITLIALMGENICGSRYVGLGYNLIFTQKVDAKRILEAGAAAWNDPGG